VGGFHWLWASILPHHDNKEKRNDLYTHFSQQSHSKLMWLIIFYYFFCFVLFSFCFGWKPIEGRNEIVVRNECRNHFSKEKACCTIGCTQLVHNYSHEWDPSEWVSLAQETWLVYYTHTTIVQQPLTWGAHPM